jgi:hypothetical protein
MEEPMDLATFLEDCDARYNPELRMLGETWNGPGYHTRIPNGAWAHPTRESLDYALALLHSGTAMHVERACEIVAAVLALQERDPTVKTYGIWPWLAEEALAEMAPPDWNWADFCGARLAQILSDHGEQLPDALVDALRVSLGHAAWSIFRRNVQPSYTNIAIMGAGVVLAAGEQLGEQRLVDYGRTRLRRFVEHIGYHGGLNEYNSPTYTIVALHECERILHLVRDPQARDLAQSIRHTAWETIAEHFHPPTAQWAGPHSRTYGDWLGAEAGEYLAAQTGVDIALRPHQPPHNPSGPTHIPALPCPPELAERFRSLPAPQLELRRRFIRHADDRQSLYGTTWMDASACLGSASWDSLWTQRRPLIGYWSTAADPAVLLRLRFLHDGQDFATAGVRAVQRGSRVLAAIGLLTNRGDFHLHLDRPDNGRFQADELRVRCELRGEAVAARQLGEHLFELAAGQRRALVHTPPAMFGSRPVRWTLTQLDDGMAVDGLCAEGPSILDVENTAVKLVLGFELVELDTAPAPMPEVRVQDGRITASWVDDLQLSAPIGAECYPA